jgi:penicillin-binding protein 1C
VRTLSAVGPARLLERLRALGVRSLDAHPERYGDGLALGNGALSLYELVQAYAALANRGRASALCAVAERCPGAGPAVFSPEVSSLIADILADAHARRLEFGSGGVLDLPVPTAVKTGTSSDHRDAWAVGFDHAHVVGIWMGNLDQRPMNAVSGASGPALALRSIFAGLQRETAPRPLYLSPRLERVPLCSGPATGSGGARTCRGQREEWIIPGVTVMDPGRGEPPAPAPPAAVFIRRPSHGLRIAVDPRIPLDAQRFRFEIQAPGDIERVRWTLDGAPVGTSDDDSLLWAIAAGEHALSARVWLRGAGAALDSEPVAFTVLGAGPPTPPPLPLSRGRPGRPPR